MPQLFMLGLSISKAPLQASTSSSWARSGKPSRTRNSSSFQGALASFGHASMTAHPDRAGLGRLKSRIQGLRSKTTDNGCTEAEALLAAAKVAELLDRYDLSLTDIEIRDGQCELRHYETRRKKRIPLDACIGDIANFCDCRVWREKSPSGNARYVFFGLRADIEAAHYLTELIDNTVRSELGRYKNSAGYRNFRHQDRHMANSSFTLGMIASIADKLTAMKRGRDAMRNGFGRDIVVLKTSVVDAELAKLDLQLWT